MSNSKQHILKQISFGESIAEQEANKLKDYFLETEYWNLIRNGTNDIVYGAKGAGKSAIYTSLINERNYLLNEKKLIISAENPSGNTAFSNLRSEPPTSQTEFIRLWKLYFLVITASELREKGIEDEYLKKLNDILTDCNLIPAQNRLASILKVCYDFLKSFQSSKEVSTTAEFDPNSGLYVGQKFSIAFGEQSKSNFEKGLIPIESVYELLQNSLKKQDLTIWIVIDRLDVAFLESEDLETNALRAIFKTYLDLQQYPEIKLKIFLRDDIWRKITSQGFREASHITKYQYIQWSKESLLNLIVKRLLDNNIIVDNFHLNKNDILGSFEEQETLFYRLFPPQIDVGSKKPNTLDWILSRCKDGKGVNTPREIIQLLNHAKLLEIKRLENGIDELDEDKIFSRSSLKEAIKLVSQARLTQTLYAEFPLLKESIEKLRGDKAEHTITTLSEKWKIQDSETIETAKKLVDIGFFEEKGNQSNLRYKIPFLYRPYLEIIQGLATSDGEDNEL